MVESYENLDRLDRDLIALEKNPNDREILASVFRTIHTIKGTSGFLAFDKLGAVAHVGENLLGRLRDGQLALDREITTALLAMVDAVRQMLAKLPPLRSRQRSRSFLRHRVRRRPQPRSPIPEKRSAPSSRGVGRVPASASVTAQSGSTWACSTN